MSDLLAELSRIEALAEAAMPAPWSPKVDMKADGSFWILCNLPDAPACAVAGRGEWPVRANESIANAYFIAEARTLIPRMAKALRIAEGKLDAHDAEQTLAAMAKALNGIE